MCLGKSEFVTRGPSKLDIQARVRQGREILRKSADRPEASNRQSEHHILVKDQP